MCRTRMTAAFHRGETTLTIPRNDALQRLVFGKLGELTHRQGDRSNHQANVFLFKKKRKEDLKKKKKKKGLGGGSTGPSWSTAMGQTENDRPAQFFGQGEPR